MQPKPMLILSMKQKITLLTLCTSTAFLLVGSAQADSSFWQVNDCRITGTSADITLSTDASISFNRVHFRLVSDVPLKNAPELQLNTARFTGFDLEGSGSGFGFEMEYSPMQVSYFLKPEATLVAAYEPIYAEEDGGFYTYHAAFPMYELPELIAQVADDCGGYLISQK
tara:strand:- start:101324 stop:101830 length:507 start_codon:yes stop_codon:yes gene_type:complete